MLLDLHSGGSHRKTFTFREPSTFQLNSTEYTWEWNIALNILALLSCMEVAKKKAESFHTGIHETVYDSATNNELHEALLMQCSMTLDNGKCPNIDKGYIFAVK